MFRCIQRVILVCSVASLAGCVSIGPGSVKRDRLDYADAIANSWREQMLLNIVKLRYFDAPIFLEVSSVISSYTLQSQLSAEAQFYPFSSSTGANNTNRRLGMSGIYTDRPTISYTPVTGQKYIEKLLRPIPPQAIFAMIQAGHQADFILALTVRAINGVYNYSAGPARAREGDPRFLRLIEAIRRLQQAGALSVRTERRASGEVTLLSFSDEAGAEVEADIRFVEDALRIDLGTNEVLLNFGSARHRKGEVVLLTRSMWEILAELSTGVEVPDQDIDEGRATAMSRLPLPSRTSPKARILAGSERPTDAYVAVQYRDRWFWLGDRDLGSKRIFTFLMVFSSIAETGVVPQVPVLTIPAN